jgi:GntR family transcriptional regulator
MVHLHRLRFAGDSPLAVDETWLPNRYGPALLHVDFEHTALYIELNRLGVRPTAGWEHLHPAMADADTRRLLGIPAKQAVFVVERSTEFDGEPLEWRVTTVRGDHYSFVTTWSAREGGTSTMQRHPD